MTRRRILSSLAAGAVVLVVSFVLTNVVYMLCVDWINPGSGSMAAMGGLVLGLMVGFVCALVTVVVVLRWPDRTRRS